MDDTDYVIESAISDSSNNRLHVRKIESKKEATTVTAYLRMQTLGSRHLLNARTSSLTTNTEVPRGPLSEAENDRRRKNNLCISLAMASLTVP
jgi:hypothetical protein